MKTGDVAHDPERLGDLDRWRCAVPRLALARASSHNAR
jgi:hypothetical protein